MLIKDQAICIRVIDFSETSQVVTFFTAEHGKLSAVAKGSKRHRSAFQGPIEVFTYGQIVFVDRPNAQLVTLTELAGKFDLVMGLSRSLLAYNAAVLSAELVDRFSKDRDPHPGLYDTFLACLRQILELNKALVGLIAFELELLRHVGMQPVLDRCGNCGQRFSESWHECFFSPQANGLVCKDCEGAFPDRLAVFTGLVRLLQDRAALISTPRRELIEAQRLVIAHISSILGRPPRSADLVMKAFSCQDNSGG